MLVRATAPARVDLAGGTLDIWPLCNLVGRPAVTLNYAVNLRAHATVEDRDDGRVHIRSVDRNEEVETSADAMEHDRLGLATRIVECIGPAQGVSVVLEAEAPGGSGLGGSSAMGVALAAAMYRLRERTWSATRMRTMLQNIETRLMGAPTGYQDFIPPLHGGLHVMVHRLTGLEVARQFEAESMFAETALLVDTCESHHSGNTNWTYFRGAIEGEPGVLDAFREIAVAAEDMRAAVAGRDLEAAATALNREWAARRRLSSAVSTPKIDAIEAAARDAGALGAKICGAGGGGCLLFLHRPGDRDRIAAAAAAAGGQRLPVLPDARGVTVEAG